MQESEILEIFQIITGNSKKTLKEKLNKIGGLRKISSFSITDFEQIVGFSNRNAKKVFYALKLGRAVFLENVLSKKMLLASKDVFEYMSAHIGVTFTEEFWILGLNVKQQPLHINLIAKGTFDQVNISIPEIFGLLLRYGSPRFICCHTHPSGDPKPSEEDLLLTDKLAEASLLLGVSFMDHIILGHSCFFSLQEKGYM